MTSSPGTPQVRGNTWTYTHTRYSWLASGDWSHPIPSQCIQSCSSLIADSLSHQWNFTAQWSALLLCCGSTTAAYWRMFPYPCSGVTWSRPRSRLPYYLESGTSRRPFFKWWCRCLVGPFILVLYSLQLLLWTWGTGTPGIPPRNFRCNPLYFLLFLWSSSWWVRNSSYFEARVPVVYCGTIRWSFPAV